jgi:thiamine-monophosphate kinase
VRATQWRAGLAIDPGLRERLDRPQPRVAMGRALAALAHACVDVSDGLLADLGHVCAASGVGAEILADAVPCSEALRAHFDATTRRRLQLAGGDDYELCFTTACDARDAVLALAADHPLAVTCIGRVVAGAGVRVLDGSGAPWTPGQRGHEHFGAD